MDPSPESEVLHEGWMVKSPPLEAKPIPGYSLFKAVSTSLCFWPCTVGDFVTFLRRVEKRTQMPKLCLKQRFRNSIVSLWVPR